MRKAIILVAVFSCLPAGLFAWYFSADVRGEIGAQMDLKRGHHRYLTAGLPVAWYPQYAEMLKDRFGIETIPVAGCVVSQSLLNYMRGYNSVSVIEAKRRFGRDVFKESAIEASQNWAQLNHEH